MAQSVKEYGRCTKIALAGGHEFEFEAYGDPGSRSVRIYAEKWKNGRVPLDAVVCREVALAVAEQRLRRRGLI